MLPSFQAGKAEMKSKEEVPLNDSGIVEDIFDIKNSELSEYERIREENIKERLKMWDDLEIDTTLDEIKSKSPLKKRKRRSVNEKNDAVIRKSARIADVGKEEPPAENPEEEDDDEDYDPKFENKKKPRGKFKIKTKPPKKLQYFEDSVLVCSISFTSPGSSKRLSINYWS